MLVCASSALTDSEFLAALRDGTLPVSCFRHADHLRLVWLHLHQSSFDQALRQVRDTILAFAQQNGVPHRYHETITTAWVKLVATHHEPSFETFLTENEARLTKDLLHRFWTPALLESQGARDHWIAPDRNALPG